MPKRNAPDSLEENSKKSRTLAASSSSSSSATQDNDEHPWEALVHSHFPDQYELDDQKTDMEWRDFYQSQINNLLDSFADPRAKKIGRRLFSSMTIGSIVDLSDSEQEILLTTIIEMLEGLMRSDDYQSTRNLATLLYQRLPMDLATTLYERAIQKNTSLSNLHWAMICRQPLSSDLAANINEVSCTPAIHLAAFFNSAQLIHALKKFGANLDLKNSRDTTASYLAARMGLVNAINALITEGIDVDLGMEELSPLYIAAAKGHLKVVKSLIKEKADVDQPDVDGLSPLLNAAANGYFEIVKSLSKAGANVKKPDNKGNTPLIYATNEGHCNIVSFLLQEEGSIYTTNNDGATLLIIASVYGHLDVVNVLLEKGAGGLINRAVKNGATALFIAANNNHPAVVERLLQVRGIDFNQPDSNGSTPLYTAALRGNVKVIEHLLKINGIQVNQPNNNGATPLHAAAQNGHFEVLQSLLAAGGLANQPDNRGRTPLWIAAANGHLKIVNHLLRAGGLVNQPDNDGLTPLHIAAREGRIDVVQALLGSGGNANQPNNRGNTPLHLAATAGHTEIVKALLGSRGDANQPNDRGDLPIFNAALKGHSEIVNLLLHEGNSYNRPNNNGETPLYAATWKGHLDIVNSLLQAGALTSQGDDLKTSPLLVAARKGHIAVIKTLIAHGATDPGMRVLEYAVKAKKADVIDAFFESGLNVFPAKLDRAPWLAEELSSRSQANIKAPKSSLLGLSLFAHMNGLRAPNEIPKEILAATPKLNIMPMGYAPDGRWLINEAIKGDKHALAYLQAYDDKTPGSLASWFKQLGSGVGPFRLALKLVTARTTQTIELSDEEQQAFYSGRIDNLDDLCNRYDCELLIDWINNLIAAPEMAAFDNSCFKLSNKILRHQLNQNELRITALEKTVSQLIPAKTEEKAIRGQQQITDFFKPKRSELRFASSSSSYCPQTEPLGWADKPNGI
ncbi:ankyrin repeat domain-containing protein [Legionella massiliensis]|nr:ankyrin repeat domain-containing protein [Legionella massiliensis]